MTCLECSRSISPRSRSHSELYLSISGRIYVCGEICLTRYNQNTTPRVYVGSKSVIVNANKISPVQLSLPGILEEFMYPTHESDFAKKCPREWSPDKAVAVAAKMSVQYDRKTALKKARKFRLGHRERSWGWKFWDVAVGYLEDL